MTRRRSRRTSTLSLFTALSLALISPSLANESPRSIPSTDTASLPVGVDVDGRPAQLPQILPAGDAALYRTIFRLQEDGDWKEADAHIARLKDKLLMGHVLHQRYMHPTKYRSRYAELKEWMAHYADHPDAGRVYDLALRRRPSNWKMPEPPMGVVLGAAVADVAAPPPRPAAEPDGTVSQRRHARYVQQQVKSYVRRGRPTNALELMEEPDVRKGFDSVSYDRTMAIVARGYFHADMDKKALEVATPAIRRSGVRAPMALWWAGLSAWRLQKYDVAAAHFEALSTAPLSDEWITSAAAFWAARAYLVGRKPDRVNEMMERAARHSRTFYGLLAARSLGETPAFEWEMPKLGLTEMDLLSQAPGAKRALALLQIGQAERAEEELTRFTGNMSPDLARVLLGLTAQANLPELSYRLGRRMEIHGGFRYDAALYPVPQWVPKSGYNIDRAIIFALIRQESEFRAEARSPAGATGLMQLMPQTAGALADRRFGRDSRHELFEPEYNIELGQKYIKQLLEFPEIEGNLFFAAAAYNGGPGNLQTWRKKAVYNDDPLLFIESIPSRETRHFVERVLTNLWIYRFRLGQPTPSLDAVAAGTWPRYNRLDTRSQKVVKSAD